MPVYAANGTLVASAVTNLAFTSNKKYIIVSIGASPAGTVYITTDGSTPTVGGNDTIAVASGTTVALTNKTPKQDNLTTTIPGPTDPSAVPTQSTQQSKVNMISSAACVFNIELSGDNGALPVLG